MNDLQDWFKIIVGFVLIIGGIVLGVWLCLWVLLYGGIMQAVENWGTNNSAVVWGIIKAVFFEVGMIPAYISIVFGSAMLQD